MQAVRLFLDFIPVFRVVRVICLNILLGVVLFVFVPALLVVSFFVLVVLVANLRSDSLVFVIVIVIVFGAMRWRGRSAG